METSINFNFEDPSFKNAKKHFSRTINNSIENTKNKEKWLKILQLFFYSNEVDKSPTIINKVLNYLYTGKLGDGKFTSQTNDLLINSKKRVKIISHFGSKKIKNSEHLIDKKNFFLKLYKLYLEILHEYFSTVKLKEPCKTYGRLLIYEAPPFKEVQDVVDHFLLNGGAYLNAIIDANPGQEFSEEIKKDSQEKVNAFINHFKTMKTKKTSIQKKNKSLFSNLEKAVTSEIVYIDLILAPIYIDSELRKAWSTKDEFLFDNKTLPVLLFEWAIEHFKYKIREKRKEVSKTNRLFSSNCLIAIGTPINTSNPIFLYYYDKSYTIEEIQTLFCLKKNKIKLSKLNDPKPNKKGYLKGINLPLFKSNVVNNVNPNPQLVKNAFDILD